MCVSKSFNFTEKPVDPTVVIEGVNSTQVQLVWNFTAAPSSSFAVIFKRRRSSGSQLDQIASYTRIGDGNAVFGAVNPDYEANLPATLVIKDVKRNDDYVYRIGVLDINAGAEEVLDNEVTVDLLCK